MAKENNAEVLFMLLANEEDLNTSPGDKAWTPYREVMTDTANRHGAPLIKVTDLFQASGLSKEQLFLDEMHPTPTGHQIMGKALADLLASNDWVNGGSIMGKGDGSSLGTYTDPFIKGASATGIFGTPDGGAAKISGDIVFTGYKQGVIQIDVMTAQTRESSVLNVAKVEKPGPFTIPIGVPQKITLRAYIDEEGDGPDADDPLIDLSKTIIHLDQNPEQMLIVDLDKKVITAR